MIRWLFDSIKFLALLITSFCLVVGNGLLWKASSFRAGNRYRVTTTKTGAVDLGRTDIDRTAIVPVKTL